MTDPNLVFSFYLSFLLLLPLSFPLIVLFILQRNQNL